MKLRITVLLFSLSAALLYAAMSEGPVSVNVFVGGTSLQEYAAGGRVFVGAKPGDCYDLVVSNRSTGRVLAVLAVDGLDVVKGVPAAEASDGYVIDAGQSVVVKGWRESLHGVRQFTFVSGADSYAAKTGHGVANNGVIACKVYAEKVKPTPPTLWWQQGNYSVTLPVFVDSVNLFTNGSVFTNLSVTSLNCASSFIANPAVNVSSVTGASALGTAFGKPVADEVRKVDFEKGGMLLDAVLYYRDGRDLERFVELEKWSKSLVMPSGWAPEFCPEPSTR